MQFTRVDLRTEWRYSDVGGHYATSYRADPQLYSVRKSRQIESTNVGHCKQKDHTVMGYTAAASSRSWRASEALLSDGTGNGAFQGKNHPLAYPKPTSSSERKMRLPLLPPRERKSKNTHWDDLLLDSRASTPSVSSSLIRLRIIPKSFTSPSEAWLRKIRLYPTIESPLWPKMPLVVQ